MRIMISSFKIYPLTSVYNLIRLTFSCLLVCLFEQRFRKLKTCKSISAQVLELFTCVTPTTGILKYPPFLPSPSPRFLQPRAVRLSKMGEISLLVKWTSKMG